MSVRRGLSMVELLVVIAAIGLLLGIVMPTLSASVAASRDARCTASLGQLALAAASYATDHQVNPPAVWFNDGQGGLEEVSWDAVRAFGSGAYLRQGAVWSYCNGGIRTMQCPCLAPGPAEDPTCGFNYNTTFVGAEGRFPITGLSAARAGVAPAACRFPSHTACFGDAASTGSDTSGYRTNRWMRAPGNSELDLALVYAGAQGFRHRGRSVVSWLDGHASIVDDPAAGEHATDGFLSAMGFPQNGFLADNDAPYDPRIPMLN